MHCVLLIGSLTLIHVMIEIDEVLDEDSIVFVLLVLAGLMPSKKNYCAVVLNTFLTLLANRCFCQFIQWPTSVEVESVFACV